MKLTSDKPQSSKTLVDPSEERYGKSYSMHIVCLRDAPPVSLCSSADSRTTPSSAVRGLSNDTPFFCGRPGQLQTSTIRGMDKNLSGGSFSAHLTCGSRRRCWMTRTRRGESHDDEHIQTPPQLIERVITSRSLHFHGSAARSRRWLRPYEENLRSGRHGMGF